VPIAQDRPPAIFIADVLILDFLNSIATPVDTPIDWLDSGDGRRRRLAQARLAPADALDELKGLRGFVRKHVGRPLAPKALRELEPLNSGLATTNGLGGELLLPKISQTGRLQRPSGGDYRRVGHCVTGARTGTLVRVGRGRYRCPASLPLLTTTAIK
jgi:hypothetical protein